MYQEKADRAEQWLHKVYTEIEDRFLRPDDAPPGSASTQAGRPQSRLSGRATQYAAWAPPGRRDCNKKN